VRSILAIIIALSVAGCASKMIDERASKYLGQPATMLIAKLGFPTDERVIAGKKIYIWYTSTFDEGTQLKCQFRAILGPGDIVEAFDGEGNNGPCLRYAMRL
jgi:hypothetical protein